VKNLEDLIKSSLGVPALQVFEQSAVPKCLNPSANNLPFEAIPLPPYPIGDELLVGETFSAEYPLSYWLDPLPGELSAPATFTRRFFLSGSLFSHSGRFSNTFSKLGLFPKEQFDHFALGPTSLLLSRILTSGRTPIFWASFVGVRHAHSRTNTPRSRSPAVALPPENAFETKKTLLLEGSLGLAFPPDKNPGIVSVPRPARRDNLVL